MPQDAVHAFCRCANSPLSLLLHFIFIYSFIVMYSGIGLSVSAVGQQLQCTIYLPGDIDPTKPFVGLYGQINSNSDDDLLSSNGIQLASNASEEDIYWKFGQTCKCITYR